MQVTRLYHDKFNFSGNPREQTQIRNHRWKGILIIAALLGVAVYLIWDHVREAGFDASLFWSALERISPAWLALAFAFALSTYLGRALRWAILIRPAVPNADLWGLTSATAVGFTAITLLGRPGEFVRPYLIARRTGTTFSYQIAALMLERVFDLLAALLVFGFGLSQLPGTGLHVSPGLDWVLQRGGQLVFAIGLGCVAAIVAAKYYSSQCRRLAHSLLALLPHRLGGSLQTLADSFFEGLESLRSGSTLFQVVAYTVVEWMLIWFTGYCVIRAFPDLANLGAMDVVIFMGFIAFGAVIQIPGIGGGVQVVTILVLTELFHYSLEIASSVALVLWLTTFVAIVPFGLILAFREGIQWGKLRHVKEEVA